MYLLKLLWFVYLQHFSYGQNQKEVWVTLYTQSRRQVGVNNTWISPVYFFVFIFVSNLGRLSWTNLVVRGPWPLMLFHNLLLAPKLSPLLARGLSHGIPNSRAPSMFTCFQFLFYKVLMIVCIFMLTCLMTHLVVQNYINFVEIREVPVVPNSNLSNKENSQNL